MTGADGEKVPAEDRHLMADEHGQFPIGSLNSWKVSVLEAEMAQPGFLASYRNPGRASDDSLAITCRG